VSLAREMGIAPDLGAHNAQDRLGFRENPSHLDRIPESGSDFGTSWRPIGTALAPTMFTMRAVEEHDEARRVGISTSNHVSLE
jgi:hypothetical protein